MMGDCEPPTSVVAFPAPSPSAPGTGTYSAPTPSPRNSMAKLVGIGVILFSLISFSLLVWMSNGSSVPTPSGVIHLLLWTFVVGACVGAVGLGYWGIRKVVFLSGTVGQTLHHRSGSAKDANTPTSSPQASANESTVVGPILSSSATGSAQLPPAARSPDATGIILDVKRGQNELPKTFLTFIHSQDPSLIGTKVVLTHFPYSVGRGQVSNLQISDPFLSRQHVVLNYQPGMFTISDLSSNGCYVNGRRIGNNREEPLFFGTHIQLSRATTLAFNCEELQELPDLLGKVIDGRYRLTKRLHTSVKAAVYAAQHLASRKSVAIKVLSPQMATYSGYLWEFRREAETSMELRHSHICKVVDFGETEITGEEDERVKVFYLCMDLMSEGSLADRISNDEIIPFSKVVEWVRQLSDALSYAHQRGVIQSSLKPGAVVFDQDDRPYVTDFASASTTRDKNSRTRFGTPAFVAPEQWKGLEPTPATDQYSFAALIYLVCAGSRPYEGQEIPEVREHNFRRGPIPVHEAASNKERTDVPAAIWPVLKKAMAENPADRYPSMEEFAHAFEVAATGKDSTQSRKPKIFISYQRGPSAGWAVFFARMLEDHHNISVFVDTQQLDKAVRFPVRLRDAIENCDVFVCLLADETLRSQWVKEEIRIAHEKNKPMVPVFQESYVHPEDDKELEPHIRTLLSYDGVHLLDKRNIHTDHTIEDLAKIVKQTML